MAMFYKTNKISGKFKEKQLKPNLNRFIVLKNVAKSTSTVFKQENYNKNSKNGL